MMERLQELMSQEQVFDLTNVKPHEFVQYGLGCLEHLAVLGDTCAKEISEKTRVMVAGGDGTVGWVLECLGQLNVEGRLPVPPAGILPLGTDNDLSRSFGFGASFPFSWKSAVNGCLNWAITGLVCHFDSWRMMMPMPADQEIEAPHALKITNECILDQVQGAICRRMSHFCRQLLRLKCCCFRQLHQGSKQALQSQVAKAQPWVYLSYEDRCVKMLATQLSNCASLIELKRIHAIVIRTQMLELCTEAFYWNNVVRCYTRFEAPVKALFVLTDMLRAGVVPDCYSIPLALKCASQAYDTRFGREIHAVSVKLNLVHNEFCESGFISLYAKVGEFKNARKVFDENCERNLGSWNAVISGLAQGGRAREAIEMFLKMRNSGFEPDDVTMGSVTSACGSLGDMSLALQLHKCVYQARTLESSDVLMLNSVIDMYGKCGRMDLALRVFSGMGERNVSSWTSMIVGYATHGHVEEALECFKEMRKAGVRPNRITFVGILSACVHGGLVQEGKRYFHMMKTVYNIAPQVKHYGCLVDLVGRAGLFNEARQILKEMPMKPNAVVWGCLMGACEKFGNVEMAELVANHLQELEPWNQGCLVVLSNTYASKGLWHEVERVRQIMKARKVDKIPAYSSATS